ncbi:hypothetical protein LEP1GSC166_3614 [Leptospira kirschneri]|nr:hypothetical protein LEP1GSC198_1430 [Leptospira kirschneri str. JB]EMK10848.1 hypothetical protein LEP1GSC166_3614 [Leptospira kirschneri]
MFDVLRSIQQLTPGFQPEPKIKLVEQVLIHPGAIIPKTLSRS